MYSGMGILKLILLVAIAIKTNIHKKIDIKCCVGKNFKPNDKTFEFIKQKKT